MKAAQIERTLHQEVMLRLKLAAAAGRLRAVYYAIPNGFWIPTRSVAERSLAARLVRQMKERGMLTPGALDIGLAWHGGSGFIELKRPATKTLLGKLRKGTLSDDQEKFGQWCDRAGVPWRVCTSWSEVEAALMEWGALA